MLPLSGSVHVSPQGGIEGGVVGEFATVIVPLKREGGREGGLGQDLPFS